MVIVDSHAHLGKSAVSKLDVSEEDLLLAMDQNEIDISIVLPHPIMADYKEAHDDIGLLSSKYKKRIFGVASLSPQVGQEIYQQEVTRCVRELGFVAIKYHPVLHNALPTSQVTKQVFNVASSLDIPVIVHTGLGLPWAHPSHLSPLAREFPDVLIVFAHSGFTHFPNEALQAAIDHPNIFLETSWTSPEAIRQFVDEIGSHRVMMGADGLLNIPVELKKYEVINLNERDLENCLGLTALNLFKITTI